MQASATVEMVTVEKDLQLISLPDRKRVLLSDKYLQMSTVLLDHKEKNKKMKERKKKKLTQQLQNAKPSSLSSPSYGLDITCTGNEQGLQIRKQFDRSNANIAVDGLCCRATSYIIFFTERERFEIEKERQKLVASHTLRATIPFDCSLIVAPMVNQSDPPFRTLCLKYGASCTYTEMLYSTKIAMSKNYLRDRLQDVDHTYYLNDNKFEDSVYNLNNSEDNISDTNNNYYCNGDDDDIKIDRSYVNSNVEDYCNIGIEYTDVIATDVELSNRNRDNIDENIDIRNRSNINNIYGDKNKNIDKKKDRAKDKDKDKGEKIEGRNNGYRSHPLVVQINGNDPKILSDCMVKIMEHNKRVHDNNSRLRGNYGNHDDNNNYGSRNYSKISSSNSNSDGNSYDTTDDMCMVNAIDFNLGCPQDRAKDGKQVKVDVSKVKYSAVK